MENDGSKNSAEDDFEDPQNNPVLSQSSQASKKTRTKKLPNGIPKSTAGHTPRRLGKTKKDQAKTQREALLEKAERL